MKLRGQFILLALFFAGLIGLWWADRSGVPDRARRSLTGPRVLPELVDLRPDELRRVEIIGGPEKVVLDRQGPGRWRLVEPVAAAADPSLVENLALNLKTLAKSTEAGAIPAKEAASFGLDNPRRTIRLWGASTSEPIASLDVGKLVLDRCYVRNVNADAIEVVDAKALSPLELSAKAWRDRSLFHIPSFQVEGVETERAEGKMALRRARNFWEIVEPWRAPADAQAVEGALGSLTSLRVIPGETGFVANGVTDLAAYGLDKPYLTVTLKGVQGQEPQTIRVGKVAQRPDGLKFDEKAELRYASREDDGQVLLIDARPFTSLGTSAKDLRSKSVGNVELPRVDFLDLQLGEDEVALARSPRGWARVRPRVDVADNASVYALVKALAELQASEILDPKTVPDSGLDKPTAVVRVWQESGTARAEGINPTSPPTMTLKVGRRDALRRSVYIQAGDEPNILAVPDAFLASLPRGPIAFRNRQILALASNLVDHFTFEGVAGRFVIQAPAKPSAQGWRMTIPSEGPVDTEALARLLALLGNLRVETFVTDKPADLKTYGLDRPSLTLTWTLRPEPGQSPGSPLETSLMLGGAVPKSPGSRYAKLSGVDTIFTLDPEQSAMIETDWRDRLVMAVDPSRVKTVRLIWRGLAVTLQPEDDRARSTRAWRVTSPPIGVVFDPGRIPSLLSMLSKLNAVKFAQTEGPIPAATGLATPKLTIELYESDVQRPRRLRVGNVSPDGYLHATTAEGDSGPTFLLPISGWDQMTKPPEFGVGPVVEPVVP